MDSSPDFGSLSDHELAKFINELAVEEMEISYRRRILHGKIDILRAELVNRRRKGDQRGDDVGGSGVREPRRPNPQRGAGGVSLPVTDVAGDIPAGPPPQLSPDE